MSVYYNHGERNCTEGGDIMYKNLLDTMSNKKITFTQVSELLHCQLRTVSEKSRGVVQSEFTVTEALIIKKVFFPEYDVDWLFKKEDKIDETNTRSI